MRWFVPTLLVVAGCGSSWQIRKGETLPYGCAEKVFYTDADGDGWGAAGSDAVVSCDPPEGDTAYASNDRDCDDADLTITGQVGAICPVDLVTSTSVEVGGLIYDESEYVWLEGSGTPSARYTMASTSCEQWAGSVQGEDGTWTPRGTLATFTTEAALEDLEAEIASRVQGSELGVFAGFVGIGWEGDLATGAWSWVDDAADDGLIDRVPWCDGEPTPADFFPTLNPEDPAHLAVIEEELPEVRLALVLPEGGDWCLGLPRDAVPADIQAELDAGTADLSDPVIATLASFTWTEGHFICQRAKPDPADYQEFGTSSADEG